MSNMKRAKQAALSIPSLKAEIERWMNQQMYIHPVEVKALSMIIRKGITPIYVGPGPHLVLEWKARSRLAAREDAWALANAIAKNHRKTYPQFYNT
jgi:hypothetical protein